MDDKKKNLYIPVLFSLAVTLGMVAGYKLHSNMPLSKVFYPASENTSIFEVLQLVRQHYVDTVNLDTVEQQAVQGVLQSLDPHSAYISAEEINEINEDLEGQFQGIGIGFDIFNDTVHVLSVIKDGPASVGGLLVGDKIISVNDRKVTPISDADQFKKQVKGPAGTNISITCIRNNSSFTKVLKRGNIPITSIDAAYMIDKEKGYVRLNRFSGNTYREFMEAIGDLKKSGMKTLILDLRDNGGGILEQSVDIIDEFIGGDRMLVYTEGLHNPRKEYRSKRQGALENEKIVVLINEGSASASEIIAGALQDLERATIVGRKSFGKGLVQEQYYLSDGGALRLTTARYYTPLGRSIQKPYRNDGNKIKKEKQYKTSSGKILLGSGGISPDISVPMETNHFDSSIHLLYRKNILESFAYRQYLEDRNKIEAYVSLREFNRGYQVTETMISKMLLFAREQHADVQQLSPQAKIHVQNRIKAMIARLKWSENGYFEVLNNGDQLFQKAVDILNQ